MMIGLGLTSYKFNAFQHNGMEGIKKKLCCLIAFIFKGPNYLT